jgi:rhodanese-related sulfurtransferase
MRSERAAGFLRTLGYSTSNIAGGIKDLKGVKGINVI